MKINGACHCGAITYEAEVDPERVAICHCTDCQITSGSAFRVVVPANAGAFKLLTGAPIYSADATNTKQIGIRVGTVQQRAELVPKRQIWCRSALGWTQRIEPIAQVRTQNF